VIRRIQIDNFKSLDGFSLPPLNSSPLANFSCIIGANGSGKTSLLQMFDYLSHVISGDVRAWMTERGWGVAELRSKHLGPRRSIFQTGFVVELELVGLGLVKWTGNYVLHNPRASKERFDVHGRKVLEVSVGRLTIDDDDAPMEVDLRALRLNGSSLALLEDKVLPHSLIQFKAAMQNLKSLELLTPAAMRRSSQPRDRIGWSGEYLAGFFSSLKPSLRSSILETVRTFFPTLVNLRSVSKEFGWRFLVAQEQNVAQVTAKHLSDGFLRILAIVSQVEQNDSPDTVILLDEIENGLHPELIERLVKYLLQAKAQIIVTTHSPLILNYLSDDEARDSMILLYRNHEGKTRSERYFDLPSTKKKLGILGPGEVYVDTPVEELAREAEEVEEIASTLAGAATE
jgi:predicted ATPase